MDEALRLQPLEYTGKRLPIPDDKAATGQLSPPYLPSPELVEAVNLAIYLKRPLLLKGRLYSCFREVGLRGAGC